MLEGSLFIPKSDYFRHESQKQYDTPENEQLEPKNHPIEKEDYLPNLYVWVPC